ncbi:O-antigen ligase family protein [Flavobacteriaceae bacterium]|nr:O-antigen ligase family protein [Flavobacteriaceae bacterium]
MKLNRDAVFKYSFPILLSFLPIIVVFFEEKPVPFVIAALVLFFIMEKNKSRNFTEHKTLLRPYLFVTVVYCLYTILSLKINSSVKILERQTSMILIPLIIFSYNFHDFQYRLFFKTFIYTMLAFGVFSFLVLIVFAINNADWINTMNEMQQNSTYLQFKFPHLIGVHPTYWSYLLIIGNIFLLCASSLKLEIKQYWILIFLLFFNFNLFFLSARTPIVINVLIHIGWLTLYMRKNNVKKTIKLILCTSFSLILFFLISLPYVRAKFSVIGNDERMFLWPKAIEQIKQNYFLLGEGLGEGSLVLKKFITHKGDSRINYNGLDLHNQYLTHYLDMGLLGIVSLGYLFLFPLLISNFKLRSSSFPIYAISFLFVVASFTESVFYVIKGIIIFVVFSSVLLKYYKTN